MQTAQRVVVLSWTDRELLLPRLDRDIVRAFTAVGVSRPVELTAEQRDELRAVLDVWDGELADGLRALHAALADDVR